MKLEDYKVTFYHLEDGSWVAEVPDIPGRCALVETREAALTELAKVFDMVA
jgi:predicted RNase H-like HicB family nuclease